MSGRGAGGAPTARGGRRRGAVPVRRRRGTRGGVAIAAGGPWGVGPVVVPYRAWAGSAGWGRPGVWAPPPLSLLRVASSTPLLDLDYVL